MAASRLTLPEWLVVHNQRNPITRASVCKLAASHRAILETTTLEQWQGADLADPALATGRRDALEIARVVVAADDHISELESVIRETVPVLERAGRMVLALKLRKLVER